MKFDQKADNEISKPFRTVCPSLCHRRLWHSSVTGGITDCQPFTVHAVLSAIYIISRLVRTGRRYLYERDHPHHGRWTAEAVAILGDRIVAVVTNEDVLNYRGDNTIMINLEGRAVTPGFIDSHTHRITQRFKWEFSTVEEAALEALSQGWTGLTELAVDENQFNELREAAEQGNLRVRVNAYLTANTFSGETLPEWYNAYQPRQQFGLYLRIAGLKIFIDGNSGRTLYWEQNE